MNELREHAIKVNKKYAKRFGINESTSITCVKPHGNSGQLLNVGSGMHPWYAPYFIRRIRVNHTDPLLRLAKDQGVPYLPEVGYSSTSTSTFVLEFVYSFLPISTVISLFALNIEVHRNVL